MKKYTMSLTMAQVIHDASGEVARIFTERLPTRRIFAQSGGEVWQKFEARVEFEAEYQDFLINRNPLYTPKHVRNARHWRIRVSGVLRDSGHEVGYHDAYGVLRPVDAEYVEDEDGIDDAAARAYLLEATG